MDRALQKLVVAAHCRAGPRTGADLL